MLETPLEKNVVDNSWGTWNLESKFSSLCHMTIKKRVNSSTFNITVNQNSTSINNERNTSTVNTTEKGNNSESLFTTQKSK